MTTNENRTDGLTDLEGDLVDIFVVVGGVLALVLSLEVVLVLKYWLPGAVATTILLVFVAVVVVLATTDIVAILALVIDTSIRVVPSLDGGREGREREESSN